MDKSTESRVCILSSQQSTLAKTIGKELQQLGWTPIYLDLYSAKNKILDKKIEGFFPTFPLTFLDEDGLQELLNQIESNYGPIRGCLHFQTPYYESIPTKGTSKEELFHAFLLAKHLKKKITSQTPSCRPFFMALTKLDGCLGYENMVKYPTDRGLSGLVKSLQKEWPGILCRFVDLDPSLSDKNITSKVLAEINDPDLFLTEVAYLGDQRRTVELIQIDTKESKLNNIDKEEVFLVSGGAKGVTAECIINLAATSPCRFILLGRSRKEDEPDWAKGLEGLALQQKIIATQKTFGQKPTPKEVRTIVSQIEANRSIVSTLLRIQEKGAEAAYISADVTEEDNLKKSLSKYLKIWGPITGIIHGAGILADQRIEKKNLNDIQNVFNTKVQGLKVLLEVLDFTKLKRLILFSSAAGFFGNGGQTDYAAANEILNQSALEYKKLHPECQVISFNWGPWEGGMVTGELKNRFEDRGVYVIPIEKGVRVFTESILNRNLIHPLLIVGSTMGNSNSTKLESPWKYSILRKLDLKKTSIFLDHRIGDNVVLPATFALEWMADSAQRMLPGFHLTQCRNFKVLKGIVYDSSLEDEYTLILETKPEKVNSELLLEAKILSGTSEKPRFHYTCGLSFQENINPIPTFENLIIPKKIHSKGNRYYKDGTLFHGSAFQGITKVLQMDEKGLMLLCYTYPPNPLTWGIFSKNFFNPMALDMGYQAILIWTRFQYHSASLPLATETIEYFSRIPSNHEFLINLKIINHNENQVIGDVNLLDLNSKIYARMLGAEVTLSKKLNKLFKISS